LERENIAKTFFLCILAGRSVFVEGDQRLPGRPFPTWLGTCGEKYSQNYGSRQSELIGCYVTFSKTTWGKSLIIITSIQVNSIQIIPMEVFL